jgi:cupredoxin-like protein
MRLSGLALAAALIVPGAVMAQEKFEFALIIKNHRFEPAEIVVPADKKVTLVVHNQDPTPEEFESHSLRREKVIPGGGKASIFIGPLKPGRYEFFGEYNEKTARGAVIAK